MARHELFSQRQKKLRGETSDVYQYKSIPTNFRVQVIQIMIDTIGSISAYRNTERDIYKYILKTLCKEYGQFEASISGAEPLSKLKNMFLYEQNTERCLDFIELTFQVINGYVTEYYNDFEKSIQPPDDAIDELNYRFKEAEIGYQFENGEIIRIDSQIMHSDVVKPVINLLSSNNYYNGANEEYLSAHKHYRHKRYKECLTDCCKSFESMLKAIHEMNNWEYKKTDTASKLIKSCFDNELIPSYTQSQFTSLKTMLESGVPTIRNNMSGHGQGTESKEVNKELVSYMVHLTATNLLFLADSQKIYQQNN
ncbi:STM4504/CBY_0614 family protein [Providencia sp. Me1]|uniref:STM4504/CBY_0614 family protein n=1 Tax=Providencia sp. Me1 TaxID=3392634 RepID=UPI003D2A9628